MPDHYVDFVRGSIAGRVAQEMALLLLEDDGNSFTSGFRDELRRNASREPSKTIGSHKKVSGLILENVRAIECLLKPKASLCHLRVLARYRAI